MPTLNRFPLLGLWAREAAHRLGYGDADADTIGQAYAVLYAIRANFPVRTAPYQDPDAAAAAAAALAAPGDIEQLEFGGDELHVSRDAHGGLIGRVGDAQPQTPEGYRYKVAGKFPAGYHDSLRDAFRTLLAAYPPERVNSRELYRLYDRWKKECGVGRLVDLEKLLRWCADHKPASPAGAAGRPRSPRTKPAGVPHSPVPAPAPAAAAGEQRPARRPNLSAAALAGAAPLTTFAELAAYWEVRKEKAAPPA
jgi:hypothetical protein